MGAVRFQRLPAPKGSHRFSAQYDPKGGGLRKFPQRTAAEVVTPKPGEPRVVPQGTDFRTPGMGRFPKL